MRGGSEANLLVSSVEYSIESFPNNRNRRQPISLQTCQNIVNSHERQAHNELEGERVSIGADDEEDLIRREADQGV